MHTKVIAIRLTLIASLYIGINVQNIFASEKTNTTNNDGTVVSHPDSYWKNKLDPQTYQVTRCSATEAPFSGKYWNNHRYGTYVCSNCGAILFQSKDKFDSGTGWPSFTKAQSDSIKVNPDLSLNMKRNEVICKRCGAHLGHVFEDGPPPTGERFCINSASLNFDENKPVKTPR